LLTPRSPKSSFHYNEILKRAKFEPTAKNKTHKMRRSVASHLQARGVDATAALGHSSSDVTRKNYLDPRILAPRGPADVLFNPLEFDKSETPRLTADEPKRLPAPAITPDPMADELA
jgi:integrase